MRWQGAVNSLTVRQSWAIPNKQALGLGVHQSTVVFSRLLLRMLSGQAKMLHIIVTYWRRGSEAIKNGAILAKLRKMKAYQDIIKMKFTIPNEDLSGLDKIEARLERSMDQMEALYA